MPILIHECNLLQSNNINLFNSNKFIAIFDTKIKIVSFLCVNKCKKIIITPFQIISKLLKDLIIIK